MKKHPTREEILRALDFVLPGGDTPALEADKRSQWVLDHVEDCDECCKEFSDIQKELETRIKRRIKGGSDVSDNPKTKQ